MEVRAEKQNVAPQKEQHSTRFIMTDKYGTRDKLDRRKVASIEKARALANLAEFSVRSSSKFYFGSVFKVLWSEPLGEGGTGFTVSTRGGGEIYFHKIRRFVIVKSCARQSICL
jgi:hypothetical protein